MNLPDPKTLREEAAKNTAEFKRLADEKAAREVQETAEARKVRIAKHIENILSGVPGCIEYAVKDGRTWASVASRHVRQGAYRLENLEEEDQIAWRAVMQELETQGYRTRIGTHYVPEDSESGLDDGYYFPAIYSLLLILDWSETPSA
jgi:hypothetical protein